MATKINILLTPGPTPVPEQVRRVLAEPIIHHRTPQYRAIFADVSEKLKKVFLTNNPVYTFAGSGTLAMETAMVNFHSLGDEVLVVDSGKFGERFIHLAKAFGLKPTVIKTVYGEAVNPAEIEKALRNNPNLKSVCIQSCETSTTVLNDIKKIGEIVSKTGALLIVDAISGLGADRLETDAWKVDLVIAGSQKALMLPPGLSFLSVSEKARARMQTANLPRYYTDLRAYEKGMKDADTPWTPAVGLVIALGKSLDLILQEGLDNVFKRCADNAAFTRQKLKELGLELFSKSPASTVTGAIVPSGIDGEKLVKVMRDEKGITMAGGQGEMKGKVIRICHMGAITRKDLEEGLRVLKETLEAMSVQSKK